MQVWDNGRINNYGKVTPFIGSVRAVHGQIVEVGYHDAQSLPKFYEVLTSVENPSPFGSLCLRITTRCIVYLTRDDIFFATCRLRRAGGPLVVPVGQEYSAGVQSFGEPVDNKAN